MGLCLHLAVSQIAVVAQASIAELESISSSGSSELHSWLEVRSGIRPGRIVTVKRRLLPVTCKTGGEELILKVDVYIDERVSLGIVEPGARHRRLANPRAGTKVHRGQRQQHQEQALCPPPDPMATSTDCTVLRGRIPSQPTFTDHRR